MKEEKEEKEEKGDSQGINWSKSNCERGEPNWSSHSPSSDGWQRPRGSPRRYCATEWQMETARLRLRHPISPSCPSAPASSRLVSLSLIPSDARCRGPGSSYKQADIGWIYRHGHLIKKIQMLRAALFRGLGKGSLTFSSVPIEGIQTSARLTIRQLSISRQFHRNISTTGFFFFKLV